MTNIRNADLNLLVAFDALYDAGSVTRAAERLSLTQPTVSGMLSRLRDLFGDPLFVRTQHGILPTPRAIDLALPVKDLLARAEALVEPEVFDPASADMTISVSANDYLQHALLIPFATRLRELAPKMRLAVLPAYNADLVENLARSSLDFAATIPEFADASLPRMHLYTERYVCVAREAHPLTSAKPTMAEFCAYDHIVVSPTGGSFSGPTDDALAEINHRRRVAISTPSFQMLLETVRQDDLLALVPQRLVEGRARGLKILQPPLLVPNFDVILCWHGRVDKTPAHQWIRALFQTTARSGLAKLPDQPKQSGS